VGQLLGFPHAHLPLLTRLQVASSLSIARDLAPHFTLFTLAALSASARLCSRGLIRYKPALKTSSRLSSLFTPKSSTGTYVLPRSPTYTSRKNVSPTHLESSRSFSSTTRELDTTTPTQLRLRPRFAVTGPSAFGVQKRYCQSEVTSSFVNMASDRDVLPAWSVLSNTHLLPVVGGTYY
jgi:hypothetical protein